MTVKPNRGRLHSAGHCSVCIPETPMVLLNS